ncbi:MAG: DNA polymerase III subunit gamma/tau [Pseudomonadota bacterium]
MTDNGSQPGSYLVLARRLRPQRFAAVLGQEHVTRSLQSALTTGRLAHAYLFCGARGVGKTTVARILARAINCHAYPAAEPCGECAACREIGTGQSVDFLEIDGASNRQIQDIRELRENVRYLPAHGRYKVYLIDEVHMLTEHAFNALLKTLEEPPPHVVFIFATTAPQKLPATILSRCQRYDFKRLSAEAIARHLTAVCLQEGRVCEPEAAALLAREAEGSARDSLSLLEQVMASCPAAEPLSAARAAEALGLIDRKLIADAFGALVAGECARLLDIVADIHTYGRDAQDFCQLLLQYVRDALTAKILGQQPQALSRLVCATDEDLAEMKRQATQVNTETLQLYFDVLMEGVVRVKRSANPRLALEMTLLKLATLEPAVPLDDILRRLARFEERLAGLGGAGAAPKATAAPPEKRHAAGVDTKAQTSPSPERTADAEAQAPPSVEKAAVAEAEAPSSPEKAHAAGEDAPAADIIARVCRWAEEHGKGQLLGLVHGKATLEGRVLCTPPGTFKPEDLKRLLEACLDELGLDVEVRVTGEAKAADPPGKGGPRPATHQDVLKIFGDYIADGK